jgi:hypothetical protein
MTHQDDYIPSEKVTVDFPRLSGHKKCREGVHFKNQEKSDG